jgi:hypothetical protein
MTNRITIDAMHERHRALTPSLAGTYQEAACVCLSRRHTSPIEVVLSDNGTERKAELDFQAPTTRERDAWANKIDATEMGAYCCVIAGVEALRDLYAVRRAETGTGADYYVGPKDSGEEDLEDCFRLEVSGMDAGNPREVERRLLEKVLQAQRGESSLPALAGVISFSAKLIKICDVPGAQ